MRQIIRLLLLSIPLWYCNAKDNKPDSLPVLFGLLGNNLSGGRGEVGWSSSKEFGYIGPRSGNVKIGDLGYIIKGYMGRHGDREFAGNWGIDFFPELPSGGHKGDCMISIFTRDKIEPFQCKIGYKDKACGVHLQCSLENRKEGTLENWATGGHVRFIEYTHGVVGAPISLEFDIHKAGVFRLKGKVHFKIKSLNHAYPKDYVPGKYKLPEPKVKAVPLYEK